MGRLTLCYFFAALCLLLGWIPKLVKGLGASGVGSWFSYADFSHLYLTGSLVRTGLDPYLAPLEKLYLQQGFAPNPEIPLAGSPPALAIILAPLSYFTPIDAFIIWTTLQISALLIGCGIVMRVCGGFEHVQLRALVYLCALVPVGVLSHLRYGQSQCLNFFFVALALHSIIRGVNWIQRLGLLLLGFSASLKLFTFPLIVVAWRTSRIRGVFWFLAGFIAPFVALALWCGPSSIGSFVTECVPYLGRLSHAFDGNLSLSAAITYTQRIVWGVAVIPDQWVQSFAVALVIPIVFFELRERQDLPATTFTMLTAACLLSPTCWTHYTVFLHGGFIYLASIDLRAGPSQRALWGLLALYVCVGANIGYRRYLDVPTQLISAWLGAIAMIAMLVMIFRARRSVAPNNCTIS